MDPSLFNTNSTDPWPSERVIDFNPTPDSFFNNEAYVGDTFVPETPLLPCEDFSLLHDSSSLLYVSDYSSDICEPQTSLANKLVPKHLSTMEYQAFEKEMEDRIGWYSKNSFSPFEKYDERSFADLIAPDSDESEDEMPQVKFPTLFRRKGCRNQGLHVIAAFSPQPK